MPKSDLATITHQMKKDQRYYTQASTWLKNTDLCQIMHKYHVTVESTEMQNFPKLTLKSGETIR